MDRLQRVEQQLGFAAPTHADADAVPYPIFIEISDEDATLS
jgi:hypothetical protein